MTHMTREQIKDQVERLRAITFWQWKVIEFELAKEINRLLRGKLKGGENDTYRSIEGGRTTFGAHSEPAQAGNPLLSYETKIVEKLWNCTSWWNPEYELIDQLKRIAKHVIEDEQEAYKRKIAHEERHGYSSKAVDLDVNLIGEPDDDTGGERHQKWEKICAAADGEKELEDYVQAVGESRRLKDVRIALNLKPGDIDKLNKKLRRRVNKLDKDGKENN